MAKRRSKITIDWILLSVFLSILLIGWLMLYAASYQGKGFWFELNSVVGRQTVWLGVSLIAFVSFLTFNWRIWNSLAFPIYFIFLGSLVAVLIFGNEINGANSWFQLFGFSVQPSEFAKISTALGISAYLSRPNINLDNLNTVLPCLIIIAAPALLIFIQPDAGTAIIFMAFFIPLFRAGLNASLYLLGFGLAFIFIASLLWSPMICLLFVVMSILLFMVLNIKSNNISIGILILSGLFAIASYNFMNNVLLILMLLISGSYFSFLLIKEGKYRALVISAAMIIGSTMLSFGTQWAFDNVLKPHQQARINVWLKPHLSNPHTDLYNLIQSKTAIGSGGLSGKGFLNGTMTKLNYVPEQHTDFVFSILGEEQGFIGSLTLILLYTFMLFRISLVAERAESTFVQYFAYSVTGIFFLHFFINIGMTMGIVPVIGIPLPLISKGGSSLMAFSIMMAILLKMDMSRTRI